ncbi:DNA methyltransferase [Microbacterium enclense]|uniref:site-specific DNA-methyltransferase (adenine-specific) n=1 Tax=Microbacterium enclense TaxID=993073 RepID=A0A1G6J4U2_9MICO|nr:DNA methyltransferase [Microbacterium enclense]KSU54742.1 restriction endonuclease subunit M [Microbacterium enclense]SDC13649.1 Type II restriction/modification system, DNA methylase subunit YeeA [Microbacterium enclense]
MASDAFIVGEDWISEHYFNTESTKQSFQSRVTALRKSWDERAKDGEQTPSSRLAAVRRDLLSALASEATDAGAYDSAVLTPLVGALGYADARWHRTVVGPVTIVAPADTPGSPASAVIRARRVDDLSDLLAKDSATLLGPFTPDDADAVTSVARCLSFLFSGDDTPPFAVVLSGTWALLAERDRWAEGRYLAVDLQLVLDRNDTKRGGESDRAVAVLSSETVLPDVDGSTWWTETLDDSVKHTVGVSKDLREGVRESIEIIANEAVRRRKAGGLDPLPDSDANVLARQSLRYLYRILFLLYAEASPEMKVLPIGAPEYALGYGLDRLRELVLVELGEESHHRTHLYSSLATLFRLVDAGHDAGVQQETDETLREGLTFNPLNADLFAKQATSLIDEVGLGDGALQRVLQLLLLTRENQVKKGRDRGFISYADLGINQLGAVYEGLMSYTGFFAKEPLFEVAPGGDGSKGSWVVPVSRADGIADKDFVRLTDPITGETKPRRYSGGEFVFRLSGRERQTSASYYSPEVLTKFVVSQALEELLDQDGHRTTAEEILGLSVCEPALGSGAFAIEAVRQLAEQYLDRREHETGERIDPDERPRELQKVKAAIALHQVYGVDLNSTAVELAEISLWLDTMVDGLEAPWFGLRLRRGNSLIGARRAVYTQKQVLDKAWLNDTPTDVPMSTLVDDMTEGRVGSATSGKIHHFLLPADGWGSAVDAKEAKELAPDAHAALRAWRNAIRRKPTNAQLKRLTALSHRVEVLWQFTLRRLEIAEAQVSRDIELWHDPRPLTDDGGTVVSRADIDAFLRDPDGAYQRLRRVMDAWCALWFWPLTDTVTQEVTPPTLDEWIEGLEATLGRHSEAKPRRGGEGAQTLGLPTSWGNLADAEAVDLGYAGALSGADIEKQHPWVRITREVSAANGFFHWELDFAGVFARGGFDLQVGNPPWVRPRSNVDALLAEGDPWWQLAVKPTQAQVKAKREQTLQLDGIRDLLVDGTAEVACTAAFVGSPLVYPHLTGLQPDLYRCFMELSWRNASLRGASALIHYETHLTDEKAGVLREASYTRLRRHWHFVNELRLFEIEDHKHYGISVFGNARTEVSFLNASWLYHPETVTGSLRHDGSGPEPGLKTEEGIWDVRPHRSRITHVNLARLASWHALLEEPATPITRTRMVYAVNQATADVLAKLSHASRLGELGLEFSAGWHEKGDRTKGYFDVEWGPVESWDHAILQGPHIFVGNPFYKSPNSTMLHNQDWSPIDLETLGANAMPVTAYKPANSKADYDAAYTHWGEDRVPARSRFRLAWRGMAANTGERTLISAIIPPGASHIHGVSAAGSPIEDAHILDAATVTSSLIADAAVRIAPKSGISISTIRRLPRSIHPHLLTESRVRSLRLLALTDAYADLVAVAYDPGMAGVEWAGGIDYGNRGSIGLNSSQWSIATPLRRASDRRQAQIEIDSIVALSLGITADELCTIYRTQFAVLYGYDRNVYFYDANGRLVPNEVLKVWRQKGDEITQDERSATNASGNTYEYVLPYVTLDREADMRQAYAHFERILQERS